MNYPQTPLADFFGGYFNQDWAMDSPTWEGIVDLFLRDEPSDAELNAISRELKVLAETEDELALASRLLRELGCFYRAIGPTGSTQAWLLELRARIEAELKARQRHLRE